MRICTRWTLLLAAVIGSILTWTTTSHAETRFAEKRAALQTPPVLPENIVPPTNDVCDSAIVIPCGNISLSGHTALATNDYTITDTLLSCLPFSANGKDVVYRIDATAGDSLWIDYSNVADGSIYMVTDCNDLDATCVIGSDSAFAGVPESIRWKFLATDTYYLILDSFGPETSGSWTASGQLICGSNPPPSNDICANATSLGCGIFSFSGNNQFASNDYTFPDPGSSCTGEVADGPDIVYRLDVDAGDSLWVDYFSHFDGSVYLMTDCGDPVASCVAGEDAVGTFATEALRYSFTFSGVYYLVLDGRTLGQSGEWSVIGELVCVNPPPNNDVCASALPIHCGAINLAGNTLGANNDYFALGASVSCTNFQIDGNDVVYQLFVRDGYNLTLDFLSSVDGSVYIVSDCDSVTGAACLYGVDEGLDGESEIVDYTFNFNGTAYLIFDSFDLNSGGAWTAVGNLTCVSVGVDPEPNQLELSLGGAYPNPFRERTTLRYALPRGGPTRLSIYDLQGRTVQTLVDRQHPAGRYHATWDGRNEVGERVEPGVYFAKLRTEGGVAVSRMIFMR